MQGQGVFDPTFYFQYRPFYPPSTFEGLREHLTQAGFTPPYQLTDLGCGTGHSILSLLNLGIPARVIGVDPDPAMLDAAEKLIQYSAHKHCVTFMQGSAENLELLGESQDAILIGSAFHWMNPESSGLEFYRVLKPHGLLRIFEYQFPKAVDHPTLNAWIKQQFNEHWRAPGQIPRGTFKQITQGFRNHPSWKLGDEKQPRMMLSLNSEQLVGLILSQSRVFHFESTLNPQEKLEFRSRLTETISQFMQQSPHSESRQAPSTHPQPHHLEFDFKLTWVEFQKIPTPDSPQYSSTQRTQTLTSTGTS